MAFLLFYLLKFNVTKSKQPKSVHQYILTCSGITSEQWYLQFVYINNNLDRCIHQSFNWSSGLSFYGDKVHRKFHKDVSWDYKMEIIVI